MGTPLTRFTSHLRATDLVELQKHYVATFDTKRRTSPYLSFWTDGDTRNRGLAILRFKQAYLEHGFSIGDEEPSRSPVGGVGVCRTG
ncbi:nitrate reductase molybdenum cofactor assembly chaperone [Demequina litorisediminis]|uniref:Uncharacterized protein n=1 Tax=Demequina litorisediminis TaxID=1849022 RepID=A0ABQ6I902_9MICO|nr:molecular chaperone TorD family protein [Demequina litorisediminis]GMA34255.1 hypothetical protein GCM10025876_04590 [Demequina litorisediminis]